MCDVCKWYIKEKNAFYDLHEDKGYLQFFFLPSTRTL